MATRFFLSEIRINNSSGIEVARYEVWVGLPTISISGSTSVPVSQLGQSNGNSFTVFSGASAISSYQWGMSPMHSGCYMFEYGNWVNVYFSQEDYYQLSCRATGECGTGPWAFLYVWAFDYSTSPIFYYPNPVSDILIIEAGATANAKMQTTSLTYDVRLYDGQGNMVRQTFTKGGTVQFKVYNLPNGIYYLLIYDGISSIPEMHQIVVVQ